MNRSLFFLALPFLICSAAFAQTSRIKVRQLQTDSTTSSFISPLYIIKGDNKKFQMGGAQSTQPDQLLLSNLSPSWIESIQVIRDPKDTAEWGADGKYGVVVIQLQKGSLNKLPDDLREKFTVDLSFKK